MSISMAFRYIAGYGCGGKTPCKKQPGTVSLALVDATTQRHIQTVYTSPPLGEYDYDNYKGYSPPIEVNLSGLKIVNSKPVMLKLLFVNNQRNMQIQMAPRTGLNIFVRWASTAAPGPHAPPPTYLRAPTNGLAVVRGPLVFALHPHEDVSIVKNYTSDLPFRPKAVDYEIGTTDDWNFAIDTSITPVFECVAQCLFTNQRNRAFLFVRGCRDADIPRGFALLCASVRAGLLVLQQHAFVGMAPRFSLWWPGWPEHR